MSNDGLKSKDEKSGLLEEDIEFRKMLMAYFIKTCSNKTGEIQALINEGDIKNAHRMAHTLKGNAAQLGKANLQKAAAEVENQLKNGASNVTNDQLKNLETELNAVISEFNGKSQGSI